MMHLPLVGSRPACWHSPELSQTMPSHFCTHTPLLQVPVQVGTVTGHVEADSALPSGGLALKLLALCGCPLLAITLLHTHAIAQVPVASAQVTGLVEADDPPTSEWPPHSNSWHYTIALEYSSKIN